VATGRPAERAEPRLGLPAGAEEQATSSADGGDVVAPFTPDTFWSEHSDAIHDVLKAPASAPQPPARRGRPWQAVRRLLLSTVVSVRRRALPASSPRFPSVRRPSVRQVAGLAALTAAAVAFVPAVTSRLAGGSRPHPSAAARVGNPGSGGMAPAAGPPAVSALPRSGPGADLVIRHRPRLAGARVRAHRAHARRGRTTTSGIFVGDKVPASSAGGGQTGNSAGSPPANSGGGQASADNGASGHSSPPPGPVGPGAPFGPGQVG
jgi:hypothetical protein